jgi:dUTP pyrophosphatase
MQPNLSFKVLKNGFENNVIPPAKGDAGWDLVAGSEPTFAFSDEDGKKILYIEYDTGVAIQPPDGFFALLFPRSSVSKYELALCNSVGVIDNGYRASIKLRFRYIGKGKFTKNSLIYKKGDKIGQLIFMPIFNLMAHQTESLDDSERGVGGFGSTGK